MWLIIYMKRCCQTWAFYFLRLLLRLEVDGVAELGVQFRLEVGHLLLEGGRLRLGDLDLHLDLFLPGVQLGLNLVLAQVDENLADLVRNLQVDHHFLGYYFKMTKAVGERTFSSSSSSIMRSVPASSRVCSSFFFDLRSSFRSSRRLLRRANLLIFCWSDNEIWTSLSP